ncbi:MAG: 30S ribosomal protein S1 [Bacteroidia bacterium]|nr:30S ribosomal protein S1 [Bacteroidia bacterium]
MFFYICRPQRRTQNLTEEQKQEGIVSETVSETTAATPTKSSAKAAASSEAFDWDMDNEGFGNYDDKERKNLEALYSKSLSTLKEGEIVQGTVVAITDREVVMNVGFKSDGLISRNEFKDVSDLKVGDQLDVFVETTEDKLGQLVLSRKKAVAEKSWETIVKAMNEETVMTGLVKSRTKGGLVVDVLGIDAFLPGSQIDVKPIRDYDQYVGKDMEFKIVKVNEVFKNVVISHKALIEDDIEAQKSDILSKLEKGQVLEGIVKNIAPFGVFVDLGGIDGLLHITDISWGRINHPEEVLQMDQKLNVVVLDFDDEKKRISLGLKQLSEHPWDTIGETVKIGDKIKGKVVTVADYGAFLEIRPGVEGLIHVSEMSWSQHLRSPADFLKVGDEIDAQVLTFDKDEHKMSLGIKQLSPDPWNTIVEKYKAGTKHTGIVKNLTSYGLFVELEEGVDGLVHVSDLSWTKKIKHPAEFIKKDEKLDVIVLEVDSENRRLSLGHKQLEENPWDTFENIFSVGSRHEGTITSVNDKGANVQLQYGIEGFAPKRHLMKESGGNVKEDEVLNFEVIEFSKDSKSIILSHTNIWKQDERSRKEEETTGKEKANKSASKTAKNMNKSSERSTMGDIEALSDLKAMFDTAAVDKLNAKEKAKTEAPSDIESDDSDETEAKAPKAKKAAKTGDDLKALTGVGPAFEKRLNAAGINTYADLIALDDEKIAAIQETETIANEEQWKGWIEEAKTLSEK